eukprot:CAMPEP_0114522220 /NCGR_PEP_ID=MMETSP0109-20121206/20627_1 /TAXON_ID=29199 /ORGANISM="Chlorarachnion reptans, Strain CCCM449" /LENGTH=587 /DNA_ID=CAMNT_0001703425 /DNA_START=45 /DNA_END=1808 /DNA_ORIENTATION=-
MASWMRTHNSTFRRQSIEQLPILSVGGDQKDTEEESHSKHNGSSEEEKVSTHRRVTHRRSVPNKHLKNPLATLETENIVGTTRAPPPSPITGTEHSLSTGQNSTNMKDIRVEVESEAHATSITPHIRVRERRGSTTGRRYRFSSPGWASPRRLDGQQSRSPNFQVSPRATSPILKDSSKYGPSPALKRQNKTMLIEAFGAKAAGRRSSAPRVQIVDDINPRSRTRSQSDNRLFHPSNGSSLRSSSAYPGLMKRHSASTESSETFSNDGFVSARMDTKRRNSTEYDPRLTDSAVSHAKHNKGKFKLQRGAHLPPLDVRTGSGSPRNVGPPSTSSSERTGDFGHSPGRRYYNTLSPRLHHATLKSPRMNSATLKSPRMNSATLKSPRMNHSGISPRLGHNSHRRYHSLKSPFVVSPSPSPTHLNSTQEPIAQKKSSRVLTSKSPVRRRGRHKKKASSVHLIRMDMIMKDSEHRRMKSVHDFAHIRNNLSSRGKLESDKRSPNDRETISSVPPSCSGEEGKLLGSVKMKRQPTDEQIKIKRQAWLRRRSMPLSGGNAANSFDSHTRLIIEEIEQSTGVKIQNAHPHQLKK